MNHSFNVEIATKYGMLEAILLEHLNFWISKNKANKANFYDGNYWTYNSTKALAQLFPYVSSNTISRALHHLKETGLILFGNYNKSSYDRTTWYAITPKGNLILQNKETDLSKCPIEKTEKENSICQNGEMDLSKCKMEEVKMQNGSIQNDKPIPDINTDINTDVNTVSKDTVCKTQNSDKQSFEQEADVEALILNDGTEWKASAALVAEYVRLYPNVDVKQQFNEMRAWCIANRPKCKTKRGITRFVNNWLSKEQDKGYRKTPTYNNCPQNLPLPEKESHNPDIFEQLINESRADVMEWKGE